MWRRIRYNIAKWLVPEVAEVMLLKTEIANWQEGYKGLDAELDAAYAEKTILLSQVEALKKHSDDASAKFEFVQRMADRLYSDLATAKGEFIAYLVNKDRPVVYENQTENSPAFLHPEDIMARINAITAEADEMYGE